ncbi:MAG: hypothetical protein ACRC30_16020 [Clostridium sp.]
MKKMLLKEDSKYRQTADEIDYEIIIYNDNSKKQFKNICNFTCGNENIDEYLKEKCLNDLDEGLGLTKVILNSRNKDVIGFYTLCTTAIVYRISGKDHYKPSMEVKYFAMNERYQGLFFKSDNPEDKLTLSDMIFSSIIGEINEISETICGISSIVLYAVPKAYNFYKKNFFEPFNKYMARDEGKYIKDCIPMFMEL